MFIESVHGLQATSMSLNDRFTMLASATTQRVIRQKRANIGGFLNQNINYNTEDLIELIARKLQQQARLQAVKQRLNMGNQLRRYGSENNLSQLRRSNSFSNLSQRLGFRNRGPWRQSNNNLNRSMSFGKLSQGSWQGRGFWRRGSRGPAFRSLLRDGRLQFKRTLGRGGNRTQARTQNMRRRMRGRGRGGAMSNQGYKKPVPTKEELDAQLDQYMASTKVALDRELDSYMKNIMDME